MTKEQAIAGAEVEAKNYKEPVYIVQWSSGDWIIFSQWGWNTLCKKKRLSVQNLNQIKVYPNGDRTEHIDGDEILVLADYVSRDVAGEIRDGRRWTDQQKKEAHNADV